MITNSYRIVKKIIFCILVVYFLLPTVIYSDQNIFDLENPEIEYYFDKDVEHCIVDKGVLINDPRELLFKKSKSNFGYTENQVWARIKVRNNSNLSTWILKFDSVILDYLDVYIYKNNNLSQNYNSGDMILFSNRSLPIRNFNFEISLERNVVYDIYFSIKSSSSIVSNFSLVDSKKLLINDSIDNIIFGLIFGGIFIISIYNLFISIYIKDLNYLYYFLYTITLLIFHVAYNGFLFQFVLNNNPSFLNKLIPLTIYLSIISLNLFSYNYLQLNKIIILDKIFSIYKKLLIIFFLILVFNIEGSYKKISILALVVSIFLLLIGLYSKIKKIDGSGFYLLATLILILSTIIFTLRNLGYLQQSFLTSHSLLFGSIIEIIIFSLGLTRKVEKLRIETDYLNKNLSIEVQKRTNEIENEKIYSIKLLDKEKKLNQMIQTVTESKDLRDLLKRVNSLIINNYNIKSYIVSLIDEENKYITPYEIYVENEIEREIYTKIINTKIPLSKFNSLQVMCMNRKKSFLSNREFRIETTSEEERYIINLLCMTSTYIIPLLNGDMSYGVFTFADNVYYQSNLDKLSKVDRKDIENFIKLISPSIYQAIQKGKIEKALHDLQTTQTQLIEAERMASLGQLVGGVAHEINNPISVIRSNSELISNNLNSILKEVPNFFEALSKAEKEIFYEMINFSINNKEFLTTKEERARKKEIKKELEEIINDTPEKIDYFTEQILLLKLKSPFKNYIDRLGTPKFIESLSIAQIFVNQSNSIGNIEIAIEKATRVVFALRNYLDTEMHYQKKEVDLVLEIEKALHLYDNYIMGKINIYRDLPKELQFSCTPETLSQVWKNLIFNAVQAMYLTEKKLEIRMEKLDSLPQKVKSMKSSLLLEEEANQALNQSWIVFSITDSGEGISTTNQDKIFTPFFTTKALGEGIGLGLYVSRKIVHDHGGRIYFESREGKTEFLVALPSS